LEFVEKFGDSVVSVTILGDEIVAFGEDFLHYRVDY
jgi:hypothetical protein